MRKRFSELTFLLLFSTSLKNPLLIVLFSASWSWVIFLASLISRIRSPILAISPPALVISSSSLYLRILFAIEKDFRFDIANKVRNTVYAHAIHGFGAWQEERCRGSRLFVSKRSPPTTTVIITSLMSASAGIGREQMNGSLPKRSS